MCFVDHGEIEGRDGVCQADSQAAQHEIFYAWRLPLESRQKGKKRWEKRRKTLTLRLPKL